MPEYPCVMGFDLTTSDAAKRAAVLDAAASLHLPVTLGRLPAIAVTVRSPQEAYLFGQRTADRFRELMTPPVGGAA